MCINRPYTDGFHIDRRLEESCCVCRQCWMVRQMSRRSRQLKRKRRIGIRACVLIATRSRLSCPSRLLRLCRSCIVCVFTIQKFHSDLTWRSWQYLLFPHNRWWRFSELRVSLSSRGQWPPPSWSRHHYVSVRHWSVKYVTFHLSMHTCGDSLLSQL